MIEHEIPANDKAKQEVSDNMAETETQTTTEFVNCLSLKHIFLCILSYQLFYVHLNIFVFILCFLFSRRRQQEMNDNMAEAEMGL